MSAWIAAAAGLAGILIGGALQLVVAARLRRADARHQRADRLRDLYVEQLEFLYGIPEAIWSAVAGSTDWVEQTARMHGVLISWQARASLDKSERVDAAYNDVRARFSEWTEVDRELSAADQKKDAPEGGRAITRRSFSQVLKPAIDALVLAMREDLEDLEGLRPGPKRRAR